MDTEPTCRPQNQQEATQPGDGQTAGVRTRQAFWRRCRIVLVGAVAASITDRMTLASAGCAFYATLALFPAISTLISVYGLAFNPDAVAAQMQVLQGLVPAPAFTLISDRARELGSQPSGSLSTGLAVSLALTFWSASTGAKSVLSALNVVHDLKERRSVLRFQLTGLAMTLAAVLVAALAIALLVFIPAMLAFIGLSRYSGGLLHVAAMLLLVGLFGVSLAVFYRIGPSRAPPLHQPLLPGIVLATMLWLAASTLLSWYVAHIASFGATYGPLGAVVGIMFWFYVSAYVALLGAELNALLETAQPGATLPNATLPNATLPSATLPSATPPNGTLANGTLANGAKAHAGKADGGEDCTKAATSR